MFKTKRTALWLAGLMLGAGLSTGCIATASFRTPGIVVYDAPEPPPPRYESYGVRSGYVWIGGRYHWRGGRWDWTGGHWERERAGYAWAPGRWERRGNGHVWVEGTWRAGAVRREERRDHRQERREERREERRDHRH